MKVENLFLIMAQCSSAIVCPLKLTIVIMGTVMEKKIMPVCVLEYVCVEWTDFLLSVKDW